MLILFILTPASVSIRSLWPSNANSSANFIDLYTKPISEYVYISSESGKLSELMIVWQFNRFPPDLILTEGQMTTLIAVWFRRCFDSCRPRLSSCKKCTLYSYSDSFLWHTYTYIFRIRIYTRAMIYTGLFNFFACLAWLKVGILLLFDRPVTQGEFINIGT
jgi:hypothetical protein